MPATTLVSGGGNPLTPQVSRNGPSQSRFVEGSMNDRVSAAPPPAYLGGEQLAAYERQFYMQPPGRHEVNLSVSHGINYPNLQHCNTAPDTAYSRPRRPSTSNGPSNSHPKKASVSGGSRFLAPLWDGVKERLHLTRSRSSADMVAAHAVEQAAQEKAETLSPWASVQHAATGAEVQLDPALYPSREEVLESYKNLVASGFFSAHAIQGTRHAMPQPQRSALPPPNYPPPPPPADPLKSFTQHAVGQQHRPQYMRPMSPPRAYSADCVNFSSIPYISTRPPTAGELPSIVRPPSRDAERSSFMSARPSTSAGSSVVSIRPQRGTKRGRSDGETQARKLVKKLRKSASRLSVDISLSHKSRAGGSGPNSATSSVFPASVRGGSESEDNSAVREAQPVTHTHLLPGNRVPAKLKKRSFFGRRRESVSRYPPNASRTAALRIPEPAVSVSEKTQSPKSRPSTSSLRSLVSHLQPHARSSQDSRQGRSSQESSTRVHEDADFMDIDTPRCSRSESRSGSPDKSAAGGLAPPSFHYPYRQRTGRPGAHHQEPLSVVPDMNRGIPSVPKIPGKFSPRKSVEARTRDLGIGRAVEVTTGNENTGRWFWQ